MRDFALNVFAELKSAYGQEFKARHGLDSKTGVALDCAVIKLLKAHWTTSPHSIIRNSNGVFFSVWLDETKPIRPLLRYNVHAKKFRAAGYPKIAARKFAEKFRETAQDKLKSWPAISYPKGPGTLFVGHIPYEAKTLREDTLGFMRAFTAIAPFIDDLLQ